MRKLLTDRVKYMLENPKELFKNNYEKPQTRSKFFRDRKLALKEAMEYLTFLMRSLDQELIVEYKDKIVNYIADDIIKFLEALLTPKESKNSSAYVINPSRFLLAIDIANTSINSANMMLSNDFRNTLLGLGSGIRYLPDSETIKLLNALTLMIKREQANK